MPTSKPTTKRGGRYTRPDLPPRTLVNQNGILIENYYSSRGDHGPPHLHVSGNGPDTRIGQNGQPLEHDPEPSRAQRQIIVAHRALIRRAIRKIGRWYFFEKVLDTLPE